MIDNKEINKTFKIKNRKIERQKERREGEREKNEDEIISLTKILTFHLILPSSLDL